MADSSSIQALASSIFIAAIAVPISAVTYFITQWQKRNADRAAEYHKSIKQVARIMWKYGTEIINVPYGDMDQANLKRRYELSELLASAWVNLSTTDEAFIKWDWLRWHFGVPSVENARHARACLLRLANRMNTRTKNDDELATNDPFALRRAILEFLNMWSDGTLDERWFHEWALARTLVPQKTKQ